MAQHTPGPWFIHNLEGRLPNVMRRKMPHGEADTFHTSIHGPDKMRVVSLDWGYGRKTDEANALLIADAKAMFDLLKEIDDYTNDSSLVCPKVSTLAHIRVMVAKHS